MELEEFYKQVGGNFEDVKRRLFNEEFIRKFVLKFKDDETFDNLIDAFNNQVKSVVEKVLNDEELEEAGKLLQIVKDNYQKIIELIVQL